MKKRCYLGWGTHKWVARSAAATYLALNNQQCRLPTASTSKHIKITGRATLGDACIFRRGVVATKRRGIAPLTPGPKGWRILLIPQVPVRLSAARRVHGLSQAKASGQGWVLDVCVFRSREPIVRLAHRLGLMTKSRGIVSAHVYN